MSINFDPVSRQVRRSHANSIAVRIARQCATARNPYRPSEPAIYDRTVPVVERAGRLIPFEETP